MQAEPSLSSLYRATRQRVTSLVADLDPAGLSTPVPACPGWTVRDVVAHLTGVVEDALAGRLNGPPTDEVTGAQVERWRQRGLDDLLATWEKLAPDFETGVDAIRSRPAVIDAATHEQDIRGALGQPGARDSEVVLIGSRWLVEGLEPPVALTVVVDGDEIRVGPEGGGPLTVRTDHFDAFRWRMGRRSRSQLAALDWSGDPAPVLDHLTVFGPSATDIRE
jgi:uncharacterized protein (TIGR03083 family)